MIPRLLLALVFTTALAAQPADLDVRIDAGPLDSQGGADVTVTVETKVPFLDAEEGTLSVYALGGLERIAWSATPGVTCAAESPHILRCQVAPAAAGQTIAVSLRVEYTRDERQGHVTADLVWRDRGFFPEQRSAFRELYRYVHEFGVTNGEDAGPGSLRQALLDANAACAELHFNNPCRIRFDLGLPATIYVRTPLPSITAGHLILDGRGQVTVDGILLDRPANGLTVSELARVILRGLTIQRFPENGIESSSMQLVHIESSTIAHNGSRGVTVLRGQTTITGSVICDNARSGVFLHSAGGVAIYDTRIEDNRASGVFAGPAASVLLRDNVITGNAHFGVATVPTNQDVDISRRNRIAGNLLGQVDIGLDGPSQFPMPSSSGQFQQPNAPVLRSAVYDPATNTTTITGRLERASLRHPYLTAEVSFYGAGEMDHYLGGIRVAQPDFTYAVRGDLRGRLITATSTRVLEFPLEWLDRTTSELSTPIEVH